MDTLRDGKANNIGSSSERRRWDVPPGGIIADGAGRLRRRRPDTYHHPWSAVPVGPKSALQLSKGLNERDYLIMLMAERAHLITTEQVARVFFNSPVTARKRIRLLRERRFLATPEVDHRMVSMAVGHRGGTHNAPLVLDWNGKYLLEHLGYELRTWNAATVAQANSRFGHTLAVSEVWSYITAAARATQSATHGARARASTGASTGASNGAGASAGERAAEIGAGARGELTGPDVHGAHGAPSARDRFAVGLIGERDSVVYDEGCTGWSLHLENTRAEAVSRATQTRVGKVGSWKPRPLVRPDATLVLSISAGSAPNSMSSSRYQGDWRKAMSPALQSPLDMRATEHLGHTRFRYIFLEMETGSNSSGDMVNKIERYSRLYKLLCEGDMIYGQNWRTLFGSTLPMILVAVRDSSQVEMQVTLWARHFKCGAPGTVVLANLEVLAEVYGMGRSQLLTQPCWLDVIRPDGSKWKRLGEILGLRV